MPLRYLLDEQLRGPLWKAIRSHNGRGALPLDAVRVGDSPDLPLGSDDPYVIRWAARAGRILVALDKTTLPGHLAAHFGEGGHSPGIFLVRNVSYQEVVEFLACAAYASESSDWEGRVEFVP